MKKHAFEQVESEIRREKAETLGRAGERLEQTLREIEVFRQQLLGLAGKRLDPSFEDRDRLAREIAQKLAEHARLCEQARRLRYTLIIQREAVGLRRHEDVDRQYPMPRPLSLPIACHGGEGR
jgi:hypothetical protein